MKITSAEQRIRGGIIAMTVKTQIGFDVWLAVSARDATFRADGTLEFQYGPQGGRRRVMEITLEPSDTYTVRAYSIPMRGKHRWVPELVYKATDVYADSLGGVVRDVNNRLDA